MALPAVQDRIASLKAERAKRTEFGADEVIRQLIAILRADVRKLVSYHLAPCRYCHGINHHYQWKTPREFEAACVEAERHDQRIPDDQGGYGYNKTDKPKPDCPECNGLGVGYVRYADTDTLDDETLLLFRGVKKTRQGVQFILASRDRALDLLCQHYGLYEPRPVQDPFFDKVNQLLRAGSKAPIR